MLELIAAAVAAVFVSCFYPVIRALFRDAEEIGSATPTSRLAKARRSINRNRQRRRRRWFSPEALQIPSALRSHLPPGRTGAQGKRKMREIKPKNPFSEAVRREREEEWNS
jgi:hypothetical protein